MTNYEAIGTLVIGNIGGFYLGWMIRKYFDEEDTRDARRYRWLRSRAVDPVRQEAELDVFIARDTAARK